MMGSRMAKMPMIRLMWIYIALELRFFVVLVQVFGHFKSRFDGGWVGAGDGANPVGGVRVDALEADTGFIEEIDQFFAGEHGYLAVMSRVQGPSAWTTSMKVPLVRRTFPE